MNEPRGKQARLETEESKTAGYYYSHAGPSSANHYLWPELLKLMERHAKPGDRVLDVGCGNGATAGLLSERGYTVTGIDPADEGIRFAGKTYPSARFEQASVYDPLAERLGRFKVVVSLEVVEHCFWPRRFAQTVFDVLEPGGVAIMSTPYHGYWKNLALALFNRMDSHWQPLWDGGHVKFWSVRTLSALLIEAGFEDLRFEFAGRYWPMSKSVVVVARKPKRSPESNWMARL